MNKSKTIIGYFFVYVLICLMSTFFRAWFPAISPTQWLLIAATILSVFINSKFYGSKPFVFLTLYFFVLYLNCRSGDHHFNEISVCFYEYMVPLFAMNLFYIAETLSEKYNRLLIVVFTIIIATVTIGSIVVGQVFPEIVRKMQHTTNGDTEALQMYYRLGVSNYSLPHALPAMVPLFVYALKVNRRRLFVWLFYLVSLIFCMLLIFYSGASGAILMAAFAFIISMLTGLNGISKSRIILICILFLPFVFSTSLTNSILQYIIDIFGSSSSFDSFTEHLMDMSDSLTYESGSSGDVQSRVDRYQLTINAIFDNILIGTNLESGEHMALLDRLAYLGLAGFIPLVLTYYYHFKNISKRVNNSVKPFYIESVIFAFMMMTLKNMINDEMNIVLFAMIPIMAVYFSKSCRNSNSV